MGDSKVNIPSPDLIYVIQSQVHDIVDDIHTTIPARVISYDRVHQTVDVQTLVWDWDHDEYSRGDENRIGIRPPVFVNVPYMFPAGGGYRITWPIEPGDQVLLAFSERSIREWKIGGSEGTPKSEVRHGLGGAIAIPGLHAPGKAPLRGNDGGGTPTAKMTMGYDTGPQFMASKTELRLGHGAANDGVVRESDLLVFMAALNTAINSLHALELAAVGPAAIPFATAQVTLTALRTALNTLNFPTSSTTVFTD